MSSPPVAESSLGQFQPSLPAISDAFSASISNKELDNLAHALLRLDEIVLSISQHVFERILRNDGITFSDPSANAIAERENPAFLSALSQITEIKFGLRKSGVAYLADRSIFYYYSRSLLFVRRIAQSGGAAEWVTHTLGQLCARLNSLVPLLPDAMSAGVLDENILACIRERWSTVKETHDEFCGRDCEQLPPWSDVLPRVKALPAALSALGDHRSIRILSLDGGGVRGISSLLILESIMEKLGTELGLDQAPRPCDYFDLIGGTSTGGIIAIMLGRLSMTVNDCIKAYRDVAEKAFTPKISSILPASPKGAFSATALEQVIQEMVTRHCTEADCKALRENGAGFTCSHVNLEFRASSCVNTAVLAITKDNVDAKPTLFTTYDRSEALKGCAIWEIARATSAATTFFKPIRVGRDRVEFIDAGFGYNNPTEVLIEEARRLFPSEETMQILSIGTGLGNIVSIKDTRRSIISALKRMATSSQKVAARLDDQFGDGNQYRRFNVDRGLADITLSDWERASTITAHTQNYLRENARQVSSVARALAQQSRLHL